MTPGIDLPDGEETQVVHQEIMREDDYDKLIPMGVPNFRLELVNRSDKLRDKGLMMRRYRQFRGERKHHLGYGERGEKIE